MPNPPATFMTFAFAFALAAAAVAFMTNNVANGVRVQKPISCLWLGYQPGGVSPKITFKRWKPHKWGASVKPFPVISWPNPRPNSTWIFCPLV